VRLRDGPGDPRVGALSGSEALTGDNHVVPTPKGVRSEEAELGRRHGQAALDRGDLPEAFRQLQRALGQAQEAGNDHQIAQIEITLGTLAVNSGDLPTAEERLRRAMGVMESLADKRCTSWAAYELGRWALRAGRIAESIGLLEGSLEVARELKDNYRAAWRLQELGHALVFVDPARAASLLRDAAAEHESISDGHGQRWALLQLGQALVATRDYAEAITAYEAAVDLATAEGDTHAVSFGETRLGDLLRYQRKYEEAQAHLERGLRAAQAAGLRVEEGSARKILGMVATSRRDYKAAVAHYDTALAIANSSGNPFELARIQSLLGSAYLSVGEVQTAEALATEALRSAQDADWLDLQISTRLLLLRAGQARGDTATALEHGREALDVTARRPPDTVSIDVELELSRLYLHEDDLDAAKSHVTSALATADALGDQRRAALTILELGATLCRQGEKEAALELYYGRIPVDDPILCARMRTEAGLLEADLGRPDLSAEQIQLAETLYAEQEDIHQQAHCLDILSKVYLQQGDLLRSRRSSRQAKELWPALGSCCQVT